MGDVTEKRTWPNEYSVAEPAAVVAFPAGPLPGHGGVVIAWRGNANSENLSIGVSMGDGFPGTVLKKTHLGPHASALAPSLLPYAGRLWMAWRGQNAAHTVNVAAVSIYGDGSASLGAPTFVNGGRLGNGASSKPALYGSPYIDWLAVHALDTDGIAVEAASSPAGSPWQPAREVGFVGQSLGPVADLGIGDNQFLHAWTQLDGRLSFLLSGVGLRYTSTETSRFGPSLASFRGVPHVAWTDLSNRINVAALEFGSSTDPVRHKNPLNEFSFVAPTLFSVPATYGGERLAIAWTGADGDGLLNNATVYKE